MKKTYSKKRTNIYLSNYRMTIPCILCTYMILSLFFVGIDNKSLILGIVAICTSMWFVGEKIFPDKVYIDDVKIHNKYIYGLTGTVLLMTIMSEIFAADYPDSNLQGAHDSVYTIISYMVLFYMAYRYFYMEESQNILKNAIVCLTFITVVMSVIEFFDFSIVSWWVGEETVIESRNRVALSFGNSNYYGAFCCMLLSFMMELWIRKKEVLKKALLMLLSGCLICCVLMSKSTTALYLMVITIIAICFYEFKILIKQWIYMIGLMVGVVIILVLLNVGSGNKLFDIIEVALSNEDAFDEKEEDIYEIKDVRLEEERLVIEGTDSSFVIEYDGKFVFYDENNNILDIENNENTVTFTEEPYKFLAVDISYNTATEMIYIEIDAGYKETIDFYILNGEFKGVGADGWTVDDISGEFEAYQYGGLFTGRGYIWINTVFMLDQVVFLGKGCGNFVHNFKQYDYVGLLKSQGTHNVIIDRPHNMFLQYCMDIGMIGAVALFGLMAYVLIGWIKGQIKSGRDDNMFSVSSFVAVTVFMIFSMLNDSLVILSPYLWIFLGINMSLQSKKGHNT